MASDKTTTIVQLKEQVRKFVNDRDWTKYHNPKDVAVSIAIETAELLELFQWVKDSELEKVTRDPAKSAQLEEELADIMIYCLSLANVLNVDVSQAIVKKIEKNKTKYPVQEFRGRYEKLRRQSPDSQHCS